MQSLQGLLEIATLDQDATLAATNKDRALATSSERSGIWAPLTVMPILWLVRLGSFGKPSAASTRSTILTETSTPSSLIFTFFCGPLFMRVSALYT